ncbi:Na-translocating NADH-quinone reductase subunit A [Parasponia andersonii]|uniref:Na-translocating NADH-quinone reductase subunit A n=1 Tax=Parasponia andersonii TaxID=3476 RepID=A0A2P5AA05_PARAD|nr:Na-translocating NADH-quinone reductase subunit A [Parasponia andersonii]
MDPSLVQTSPSLEEEEDKDEWDTDGFVIPSLGIEESNPSNADAPKVESSKPPSSPKARVEENIYLGPHGAPPSQSKQQEPVSSSRKQRFKQKLKEADRRIGGTGRENKLENLRELVGGGKVGGGSMAKGSSRDWLDPHCHESQFEKWYQQ